MSVSKPLSLLVAAALLTVGFLIGRAGQPDVPAEPDHGAGGATQAEEPSVWTCSMHPQVRLPEPGKCPICFMALIPVYGGGDEDLGPRTLEMSEGAMALAEIETAPVERRSVAHEITMVGKVAFDETRLAYITAWVSGRLDRVFVDYTGVTVRPDDHLVEIYSPKLYAAQQELLTAIVSAERLEESPLELLRTSTNRTVVSAREKLRLYGLSEDQIQEVVERGTPDEHVTIFAPTGGIVVHKNALKGMYVEEGTKIYTIADLSKVWVLLDAYESDLAWLRYGQDVEFGVEAYPGETFHGRIAFIDPVLDDRTRTVKVRLNVENPDLRLKPAMFVSATAQAVLTPHGQVVDEDLAGKWMCPMHPEILSDGPESCPECGMDLVPTGELGFVVQADEGPSLVIPDTAPLVTGRRAVVYVRLPDRAKPTFEGREIALGPRAGGWYVVHGGLREGEQVVVNGNFKIDSELQIRAKPSMMSPEGGAHPPGHQHGAAPGGDEEPRTEEDAAQEPATLEAPPAFREQLGELAGAYLRLQEALAADEEGRAMASAIVEALDSIDMGLLDGAAHTAWMDIHADLSPAAKEVADSPDIESRRVGLEPLTRDLMRAMRTFGYDRAGEDLGVFHCPMALDGKGADWIQAGAKTSNPYFGSAMLRCGSRTSVLKREL